MGFEGSSFVIRVYRVWGKRGALLFTYVFLEFAEDSPIIWRCIGLNVTALTVLTRQVHQDNNGLT